MDPDHRTGLESRSPTARCLLTNASGTLGARPQLGHTRPHIGCSRIAVGQNRAGAERGGCGECGS
jgi:hypothetical protein